MKQDKNDKPEDLFKQERISYEEAVEFVRKKLNDEPLLSKFIKEHNLHRTAVQAIKNGTTDKQYPNLVKELLNIYSVPIKEIRKKVYFIP